MREIEKILYVDDEIMNVKVFQIAFSEEFNVITAFNGNEGLELLEKNPDVKFVITDMRMPGMNGLEFIREIKKINKSLPCMILSGYQQNNEIIDALDEGVIIEYMMKPLNKARIEKIILENIS